MKESPTLTKEVETLKARRKKRLVILGYYFGPKLGVGVYIEKFISTLAKRDLSDWEVVWYTNRHTAEGCTFSSDCVEVRTPFMLNANPWLAVLWSMFVFPMLGGWRRDGVALLLTNPVVLFSWGKVVAVIHDLNEYEMKGKYGVLRTMYRKHLMLPSTMRNASVLVAISNFTKKQILKYFPSVPQEKIVVIPDGVEVPSLSGVSSETVIQRYELSPRGYYLVVGRIDPAGKNLYAVLALFRKLEAIQPGKTLVFVGGINEAIRKEAEAFLSDISADEWLSSRVKYAGFVDDAVLASLYRQAEAVIFYSKYEGFGLPLVEAFALGCPVIINPACEILNSLSEGTAVVIDEDDPEDEIRRRISPLLDETKRRELQEKMARIARQYDWEKCVNAFLQLLTAMQEEVETTA